MIYISLPEHDKHDTPQNRVFRRQALRFYIMIGPSDGIPSPDGIILKINLEGAGELHARECIESRPADVVISWPSESRLAWVDFVQPGAQALEKIDNGETVVVEYSNGRQLEWKWHK